MAEDAPLPAVERDFDAIETAVMETSRGRWFLAEFKRRNRDADTQVLLAAIARIGTATGAPAAPTGDLSADLGAMAEAMERARAEVAGGDAASVSAGPAPFASALARIVKSTRSGTVGILDAAERIQEAAWNLREAGIDPAICDELDGCSGQILTACALQDVTTDRTATLLDALRVIEERVGSMRRRLIGSPTQDAAATAPPPSPSPRRQVAGALAQVGEIEFVTVAPRGGAGSAVGSQRSEDPSRAPDTAASTSAAGGHPPAAIPASLAAIEAIPFRDRMKLFT